MNFLSIDVPFVTSLLSISMHAEYTIYINNANNLTGVFEYGIIVNSRKFFFNANGNF